MLAEFQAKRELRSYNSCKSFDMTLEAITDLENGLKAQLESLAQDIRSSEAALMSLKEGYLKVQGALEIIAIIKQKFSTENEVDAAVLAALE